MKVSWITIVVLLQWATSAFCCLRTFFDDEALKLDPLTTPLFDGDSVKEFLALCNGNKYKTNTNELQILKEDALNKDKKGKDSECTLKKGTPYERTFTNLEFYYLKKAQGRVQEQQEYFKDTWKGWVRWVLFVIPLGLTVFLLLAGHFDYKTLPFLGNSMFQSDSTDGMKYQQYEWMRFLILPGNHSVFKGKERKMDDPSWVKYNRKDETFNWKTVKMGRFKFCPHKMISKHIEEEEHNKKVNMWKTGWDFGQDASKHHYTPRNSKHSDRTSK